VIPLVRAAAVCKLLLSYRFRAVNEAELQHGIAAVLVEAGYTFTREKHLSRKDRPDFLLEDGVAIEVKVDGSLTAVMRQLSRYAQQATVSVIVLVTTRATQAVRIPQEFCGKPVRVVLLAGALG
jgi:hypothetical protein